MKIISISGLDGSGKSTQIKLLQDYLKSQGKKIHYFHAGQFSIGKTYNILRPHKVITNKHKESVTKAGWLKIILRKIALVVDIFRFKQLLGRLKKEGYDFVLSDRYFYDNVINITYLESKRRGKLKPNVSYSMFHILRPDFPFYLNADPEKIMQRPRPADQGFEYLISKKKILDQFSKENDLIEIDGNGSQQAVLDEILKVISSR